MLGPTYKLTRQSMSSADVIGDESQRLRRFYRAGLLLASIVVGASVIYYVMMDGRYQFVECLYMTVITVSTVGFTETIPLDSPESQIFTIFLIITAMGGTVYFASTLTALIIEGDLNHLLSKRRMKKDIDALEDHVIVCGVGRTGHHTAKELHAARQSFVLIDEDEGKLRDLAGELEGTTLWLCGDAVEDETLRQAGIERARALVAALGTDPENLFLVFTARQLNPDLRIAARVMEETAARKLLRAGASDVVSPNIAGGRRLAATIIRPEVLGFFDLMLTDESRQMRLEQLKIEDDWSVTNQTLGDTALRQKADILVVGVRDPDSGEQRYNPGPDLVLKPGLVLIIFGEADQIDQLRRELSS